MPIVPASWSRIALCTDWNGIDPSGLTDSTAGIQRMLDRGGGGMVGWVPGTYGISSTIKEGNATGSATTSTVQGFQHVGLSSPMLPGIGTSVFLGWDTSAIAPSVRLQWRGAAGGSMWNIAGALYGFGFQNFLFDAGGTAAGTGLSVIAAMGGDNRRLRFGGFTANAIFETAWGSLGPGSLVANSMHNIWSGIDIALPSNAGATGWTFDSWGGITNTSYEHIENVTIAARNANGSGLVFRACDSVQIRNFHMFSVPAATDKAIIFDYSNPITNQWPTATQFNGVDIAGCQIINRGTPAPPMNNLIFGYSTANGAVVPSLTGLAVINA